MGAPERISKTKLAAVLGSGTFSSSITTTDGVVIIAQNDAYLELYDWNQPYAIQAGPRAWQTTVTKTSVTSNVIAVTVVTGPVPVAGNQIMLFGTAEPFLQNVILTVLASPAPTATTFSANFTNANYTNASDTGYAVMQGLTSSITMNLPNISSGATTRDWHSGVDRWSHVHWRCGRQWFTRRAHISQPHESHSRDVVYKRRRIASSVFQHAILERLAVLTEQGA